MEGTKCGVLNHKQSCTPTADKSVDKHADRQYCSVSVSVPGAPVPPAASAHCTWSDKEMCGSLW